MLRRLDTPGLVLAAFLVGVLLVSLQTVWIAIVEEAGERDRGEEWDLDLLIEETPDEPPASTGRKGKR